MENDIKKFSLTNKTKGFYEAALQFGKIGFLRLELLILSELKY
jgi:hypothetical protein